jgi:hypothetical protein
MSMSHATVSLKTAGELALTLPDVKENRTKRGTGWKVKGRLMACEAIHKSAEANSIMVCVSAKERERLIKAQPDVYYVTDHYRPYDAVLVRLSKIDQKSLRELLQLSWRFVHEAA